MSSLGASRSEGQWVNGLDEPLNPTEQFKRDDDGLNVRRRIIDIYANRGFCSIDPSDPLHLTTPSGNS
jgi:sulfite reductase (ferredoxin)